MTQTVDELVAERGKVHGDFSEVSQVGQALKSIARLSPNWRNNKLQSLHKEALDMILHKCARILCGDPDEPDHWRDVGGYAKITEDRLGKSAVTNKLKNFKDVAKSILKEVGT